MEHIQCWREYIKLFPRLVIPYLFLSAHKALPLFPYLGTQISNLWVLNMYEPPTTAIISFLDYHISFLAGFTGLWCHALLSVLYAASVIVKQI